ncbi:MAG: tetratricopeptide repeat protein, partial [Candidatus Brocadiia bacterium]
MNRLLEILGKAISVDTADLIWHWFNASRLESESDENQHGPLDEILDLIADRKSDMAEVQLRLYLFDNPSCPRGRLLAAAVCLQNNQIENAIHELNSVYTRQPNNTIALYALGHCYERLGHEEQAVEFYQDCLKFKNYLQLPRQRIAAIYFKNGRLEKTTAEYEMLCKEYPDDISTLLILGYLYIAEKKYHTAIETFNKAILIHPDNFDGVYVDFEEMISRGSISDALEYLENLHDQNPERADVL